MTFLIKRTAPRRAVLRGMVGAGAVSVGLPFLDCFLDDKGTALASGLPVPLRFGAWFWGLGHQPGCGIAGRDKELTLGVEAQPLLRHKAKMNYFGGFNAQLDGVPNITHWSGLVVCRTGSAPANANE